MSFRVRTHNLFDFLKVDKISLTQEWRDFCLFEADIQPPQNFYAKLLASSGASFCFTNRENNYFLGLGNIEYPDFFKTFEALGNSCFFFYNYNFEKTKKFCWLPQLQVSNQTGFPKLVFFCHKNADSVQFLKDFKIKDILEKSAAPSFKKHTPDKKEFEDIFQAAQETLQGSLKKVVLSRKSLFQISDTFHPETLFQSISKENFYNYFIKTPKVCFLGSSPERLLKFDNNKFVTEALAGTRSLEKKEELLSSTKDLQEQKIVAQEILSMLSPLSKNISIKEPEIFEFKNMAHLRSEITCDPLQTNIFDWIDQLHPTSAVCGYPRDLAFEFLQKNEPYARDTYASTFGILKKNQMDMTVCIRGAFIEDQVLSATVGVGIVPGSKVELEWQEMDLKLQPMIQALSKSHEE